MVYQGWSKPSASRWARSGTERAALRYHRFLTRFGIMCQSWDCLSDRNLACSIFYLHALHSVWAPCFCLPWSMWQDNVDEKKTFCGVWHFQVAKITCTTANTYADSSPFLEMIAVTLPKREILWILQQAVGLLVSLYLCVFLTWVGDSWVPSQWGRHQWCYCSQTHTGSVACGILGTDWPGLHLLFAGGNRHTRQIRKSQRHADISLMHYYLPPHIP